MIPAVSCPLYLLYAYHPWLDDGADDKDQLELESTMGYLSEKLNVSLENAELFVVLELVQAPSVGEITRAGFIDGWKSSG